MARPAGYQWEPLQWDTDPVPGDPQVIATEAAHLKQIARQVHGQVGALRKISVEGVQIGQTPDVIRSAAGALAGKLETVAARYQSVATALRGWGPELELAQRMSLQALNQAEIPYAKLHQQAMLPAGPHLPPAQQQEVTAYHTAMVAAQDELDAARALLGRAIARRDTEGAYYKGKIDRASDDGLKDRGWAWFEDLISHYTWLIKDICTALEVVATILAVVALFIPGLNIVAALLWAGFALTGLALIGRIVLAATGNGSWLDVGMDVVALLTFGAGKAATTMLKGLAKGSETVGEGLVQGERAAMAAKSEQFMAKSVDMFSNQAVARIMTKQMANIEKLAPEVGKLNGKIPFPMRVALRISDGSPEDFAHLDKVLALGQRFGNDPEVAQILTSGKLLTGVLGVNAGVNGATSIGVPAIGGLELDGANGGPLHIGSMPLKLTPPDNPVTGLYNRIQGDTTTSGGLTSAQVEAIMGASLAALAPAEQAFAMAGGGW